MKREWIFGAVGLVLGSGAVGGYFATKHEPKPKSHPKSDSDDGAGDRERLAKNANANLVSQLQECNKKLAEATGQPEPPPPAPANPPAEEDGGRRRRGGGWGSEPQASDWERMAERGMVRLRVPCLRDKPYEPPAAILDRLGLAPTDGPILTGMYEKSNKRLVAALRPVCGQAVGSNDAIDKVGGSVCVDLIVAAARKKDADGAGEAIARFAQTNAGKPPSGTKPTDPGIDKLLQTLAGEQKAFESDLSAQFGPEEGKRLAWAPELCTDMKMIRATEERGLPGFGPGAIGPGQNPLPSPFGGGRRGR